MRCPKCGCIQVVQHFLCENCGWDFEFQSGSAYNEFFIDDGVLPYCLDWGQDWYLSLNINQRVNLKGTYIQPDGYL